MDSRTVRVGYAVQVRRRWKMSFSRVLTLFLIGVLVRTTIVSQSCFEAMMHLHKAVAIENCKDAADAPDSDGGCSSSCFCCHVAGVLGFADARAPLVATHFAVGDWSLQPLQLSVVPYDKPPRA
jgi:hypothetical protein